MRTSFTALLFRCSVLALLLLLAGCQSGLGSPFLRGKTVPAPGDPLPQELWTELEKEQEKGGDARASSTSNLSWYLPTLLASRTFGMNDTAGVAMANKFAWFDLLPAPFTLPLYINYSESVYKKGTDEPVGTTKIAANPFWLTAKSKGESQADASVRGAGVPLFYSYVVADWQETGTLRIDQSLWTLGPMLARASSIEEEGTPDGGKGYVATPLFLLGAPGVILWTSYDVKTKKDAARYMGHGPFVGILGYSQWSSDAVKEYKHYDTPKEIRGTTRLLLGGLLWLGRNERDAEGTLVRAYNGPIFGLFGYGRKHERFAVRLFGISI